MATKTKTTEQKAFTLKPEFALWKTKSKRGRTYFTGKTEDGEKLIGFYNTNKKNPKEPDLRVYFKANNDEEINDTVGYSIWHNVNEKTGKQYFSGTYRDGDTSYKVVGFNSKSDNEKAPDIKFYLREEQDKPKNLFEQQAEQNMKKDDFVPVAETDEDLPF